MEAYQYKISKKESKVITVMGDFPKDSTFLYIFHADKIPPHIGFVDHNLFYSLKANSIDLALNVDRINQMILRKKIPTLIIELNAFHLESDFILDLFGSYGNKLDSGITCLNPIDILLHGEVKHKKIGELLDTLTKNQRIQKVFSFALPENYNGIKNYSINDIENRIFELQCLKEKEYICDK
ncbi:MAG TPA: hypothetical protein VFD77_01055 [Brumimicrobium sp.]|nr:hypothetical protein [Brumimicrobium sp.]